MVKRRMLAADERLASRLSEIARSRGETLYHYLNTILEKAIEVEDLNGYHPAKALGEYLTLNALTSIGMVLVPVEVLAELALKSGDLEVWRRVGVKISRVLRMRGRVGIEEIVEPLLKGVASISRVYDPRSNVLKIVCSASYPRDTLLEMYGVMLREVARGLECKCEVEVSRGLVVFNIERG